MAGGWGAGQWGYSPWGDGSSEDSSGVGNNPPEIVERTPAPSTVGVGETAQVLVSFLDVDLDLDTASITLHLNGELAYSGQGGFSAGYAGRTRFAGGTFTVQTISLQGWEYASTVTVRAYAEDLRRNTVDSTWSWEVIENPVCYSGLTPLPVEVLLVQPLATYLDIEILRSVFLSHALRTQKAPLNNAMNKAARVLYQQAFATELVTVLNTHKVKNVPALETVVCERQQMLALDAELLKYTDAIQRSILSLHNLGALPREYLGAFQDYADSTLYTYRVSLVANMILLAHLTEASS